MLTALGTVSLNAQILYSTGRSSLTISTINMEPEVVQAIDGVATIRYDNIGTNFQGSPYLTEDFVEGTMIVQNGTVIPGLSYRYDIFGDRMQFIIGQDTAIINKPLALRSLVIENKKFVHEVFLVGPDRVATGYFEVMEEGEHLTMLFRREIELEQDVYVPNYGGGGGTKEFKLKRLDSYYVKQKDMAARKIRNKKMFLEMVSDHRDQVIQYMKTNRLSIRKGKDLQAIIGYYNNLHEKG